MFKRTFIRVIFLGIIVFASFFVFVSATNNQYPAQNDCTELKPNTDNSLIQGEFIIWETLLGTIMAGHH